MTKKDKGLSMVHLAEGGLRKFYCSKCKLTFVNDRPMYCSICHGPLSVILKYGRNIILAPLVYRDI